MHYPFWSVYQRRFELKLEVQQTWLLGQRGKYIGIAPQQNLSDPLMWANADDRTLYRKGNHFGVSGNILTKPFHVTCRQAGVIMWVQLLEGPPAKIWECKKRPKFGAISDKDIGAYIDPP